MLKVYIAGAISNDPEYKEKFSSAEKFLLEKGHAVINPCKNLGFDYKDYIDMGLCELMKCDAIYLLEGWEHSKGAKLELQYAKTVGLSIWGAFASRKAVTFEDFSHCCPFFNSKIGDGYGCDHPLQEEKDTDAEGKEYGKCYCCSCPLGIEAEQEDLTSNEIDWDGMCEEGEVNEGEYLLVDVGDEATEDQKNALYSYERYMHRYDKKWLDEHNIPNSFVE